MAEKSDKDVPAAPQQAPRTGLDAPAVKPGEDIGQAEVQEKVDEETEQGFAGVKVDPLDDSAYSVQGVLSSDQAAKQDRGQGEPPKGA